MHPATTLRVLGPEPWNVAYVQPSRRPADGRYTRKVLGPAWATADRVELYANGVKVHEAAIKDEGKAGEKWSGKWTLPRPAHDVRAAPPRRVYA